MAFVPGQRWISNAEPELGLGTKARGGPQRCRCFRQRRRAAPVRQPLRPLARAEFRAGQKISGNGPASPSSVEHRDGLLHYHGEGLTLGEGQLDDVQSRRRPTSACCPGAWTAPTVSISAWKPCAAARRRAAPGLGPQRRAHRPDPAPAARDRDRRAAPPPRVLLADEVGLADHRGRHDHPRACSPPGAWSALILLPEPLVYQWFVELLRRFNLQFAVYDAERCEAIERPATRAIPSRTSSWSSPISVSHRHPQARAPAARRRVGPAGGGRGAPPAWTPGAAAWNTTWWTHWPARPA